MLSGGERGSHMRQRKVDDRIEKMAADVLSFRSGNPEAAIGYVVRSQNRVPAERCYTQVAEIVARERERSG